MKSPDGVRSSLLVKKLYINLLTPIFLVITA